MRFITDTPGKLFITYILIAYCVYIKYCETRLSYIVSIGLLRQGSTDGLTCKNMNVCSSHYYDVVGVITMRRVVM